MPLFRRSDGELVTDDPPVRKLMPYLMRGRNESAIYHQAVYDLTETEPWLRAFNAARASRTAHVFHLFAWGLAEVLHKHPAVNRFVSNGRVYQRRDVSLSFAVKPRRQLSAPFSMVKLVVAPSASFPELVTSIGQAIAPVRRGDQRPIDKEIALAARAPAAVARSAIAVLRFADRHNLLPARLIADDPMYASAFVTHLGSVGLDDSFHHLNEQGTASIFAAVGRPRPTVLAGPRGEPITRTCLQVRWTIDERIADGMYCAHALRTIRATMERPATRIGRTPGQTAANDLECGA
jgi:hypothetical protein